MTTSASQTELAGTAADGAPHSLDARPSRWSRRRQVWVAALAVVLFLGGAGGVLAYRAATAPIAPDVRIEGLPDVARAGSTVEFVVHIDFPDRWPAEDVGGGVMEQSARYGATSHQRWLPASILCSGGTRDAAKQQAEMLCTLQVPDTGPEVTVTVVVSASDDAWDTETEVVLPIRP